MTDKTANTSTSDLVVTRIYDAPIEEVWRYWIDPEKVRQWWGPDGFTCPIADMDVRVGGTSFVVMSSPDYGDHYRNWHYEEHSRSADRIRPQGRRRCRTRGRPRLGRDATRVP